MKLDNAFIQLLEKKLMGAVYAHVKLMVKKRLRASLTQKGVLESFERAWVFRGVNTIL